MLGLISAPVCDKKGALTVKPALQSNTSEIRAELDRVLASRWLTASHQLSTLLRHVVEATLAGETDRLKEYSLGIEVFHRNAGYDPRNDAIVRVQASVLRKRLASYYENEGSASPVRITLPRGGYVPEFQTMTDVQEPSPPPAADRDPEPAPPAAPRRWPLFAAGLLAGALLFLAATWIWQQQRTPRTVECPELWEPYLTPGVATVAGFGVPLFFTGGEGLFIRDTHVNQLTDDQSRVDRVSQVLGQRLRAQGDVYTGIGDAIGAHLVARWLEQRRVTTSMVNSNYIGPSDFAGRNVVIVASARFQTLLQSMQLPRHIHFVPGSISGGFEIDNPLPGEPSKYNPRGSDTGVSTSYAVVSLWPGVTPQRRILYLSGIETWSTQGAAQYVLDPNEMRTLQRRLSQDPPNGPLGAKSPFFQVLLRVEGKNNVVRSAHYVTHRYLPAS